MQLFFLWRIMFKIIFYIEFKNEEYNCKSLIKERLVNQTPWREIFSFFNRERSVFGCIPNFIAAPSSPLIFQLQSFSTFKICVLSTSSMENDSIVSTSGDVWL